MLIEEKLTTSQKANIKRQNAFDKGLIPEFKNCSVCKEEKYFTEFRLRETKGKINLRCECNSCSTKSRKKGRENNPLTPEKREKLYQKHREWQNNNKDVIKASQMLYKYSLSVVDFNKLMIEQEFCCAICNKHISQFNQNFSIDHDHITNKVRGLLCNSCNNGLGRFKDNIKSLKNAVKYLIKNK